MIGAAVGRRLFCCSAGVEPDPAVVREIQAYLSVCCRCRALVEIGRAGVVVHFEQAGEADLFAEVWGEWAAAGSAQAPSERPRATGSNHTQGSR